MGDGEFHIVEQTKTSNTTNASPGITFDIPQIDGYTYKFCAIKSIDSTGNFDISSPMNITFEDNGSIVTVIASKRVTNMSSNIAVTMMFVYVK